MKKKKNLFGIIFIILIFIVIFLVAISKVTLFSDKSSEQKTSQKLELKVGSLKGPTSMGLLYMMEDNDNNKTQNNYEFTVVTGADELLPMMAKGELDIALVPANVAAVLYNKTAGGISVIDINTLSVLYMVSNTSDISSVEQLKGKTIYLTGKGTTPDFVLQYVLEENGLLDSCTLEYKSEAAEVVSALAQSDDDVVGLLPQPFVTAALAQNEKLSIVLDMNEEWEKVNSASKMVTGVTVVRNELLKDNKELVIKFIEDHKKSVEEINADSKSGAALAVKREIVAAEGVAMKAIPYCNIVCISGEEMEHFLSGYLEVIYEKSKEFLGGALPEEDFYFMDK